MRASNGEGEPKEKSKRLDKSVRSSGKGQRWKKEKSQSVKAGKRIPASMKATFCEEINDAAHVINVKHCYK